MKRIFAGLVLLLLGGINVVGQVVGASLLADGSTHAFLWSSTGGMTDLGTLGGIWASPVAINASGQVVGSSYGADGRPHAFLWSSSGGMTDLGTLGGPQSSAAGINASGQVVGSSVRADGRYHGFLWSSRGGMTDLGTLGGSESQAYGINAAGQVVGSSELADGSRHAFLWSSSGGMTDLGTLGGYSSAAYAIADALQTGLSGKIVYSTGPLTPSLVLTNTGNGEARNIWIDVVTLRTLGGSGNVALIAPVLPLYVGNLGVGASIAVPLSLTIPSTVTKFSITEAGTVQDVSGNTLSYSIGQVVLP